MIEKRLGLATRGTRIALLLVSSYCSSGARILAAEAEIAAGNATRYTSVADHMAAIMAAPDDE